MKPEIERRLRSHESKHRVKPENDGIFITEGAASMLARYEKVFLERDGETLIYAPTPDPNVITYNAPATNSVTIGSSLWYKMVGDALINVDEEEITEAVARWMIEKFTEYGIE